MNYLDLMEWESEPRYKANNLLAPEDEQEYFEAVADCYGFALALWAYRTQEEIISMVRELLANALTRDQKVPRFRGTVDGYRELLEKYHQ
jgi:hypothetical protein